MATQYKQADGTVAELVDILPAEFKPAGRTSTDKAGKATRATYDAVSIRVGVRLAGKLNGGMFSVTVPVVALQAVIAALQAPVQPASNGTAPAPAQSVKPF